MAEYPEFAGSQASDNLLVHGRIFDAALWKILRQKVLERTDQIDILYSTPAQHLLQQADRTIVGADLWHMQNYEPGGVVNFAEPHGSRARNI